MRAPTGQQFTISSTIDGKHLHATITEVAAGLRELVYDGVDLVEPFGEGARPAKAQGIVLAPWGGRVAGGDWQHEGTTQRLAISERDKGNASHGLLRFAPYRVLEHTESKVVLQATIHPQTGWPFLLDTTVAYELTDDGLLVTHEATNVGTERAPWACGTHPYLAVGDTPADELTFTVPAARVFHAEALIPTEETLVDAMDAPAPDLRGGRRLSELDIDQNYAGLEFVGGVATSSLLDASGRGAELWQDSAFPYAVVFTPKDFPTASGPKHVAAIEPMSAPANALNSGTGLVWLEPGETWVGHWGIDPVGF
ncbi:aldose 1-epimerase family protein [Agrococcus sp. ARC_14]|uniref:aldose 1-epimerase family protein n=1 Tax=Agrococcus sp. ARC_14 TaxID=2919927 RepID=UPI001F06FFC7|nr:aldose 1-epimerase family protein [Agrococcus sp. ARC_14]MCH1884398.1 aldose 1-epimerase family protein [Agrococcus sp. ARC_14]